ncbi:hypothetical protein MIR68_010793 [Amoeboaphelidium protococcarum]|nr:hypothetical protein MIR68_010793 [Amoeboaphelidium protococcarum]
MESVIQLVSSNLSISSLQLATANRLKELDGASLNELKLQCQRLVSESVGEIVQNAKQSARNSFELSLQLQALESQLKDLQIDLECIAQLKQELDQVLQCDCTPIVTMVKEYVGKYSADLVQPPSSVIVDSNNNNKVVERCKVSKAAFLVMERLLQIDGDNSSTAMLEWRVAIDAFCLLMPQQLKKLKLYDLPAGKLQLYNDLLCITHNLPPALKLHDYETKLLNLAVSLWEDVVSMQQQELNSVLVELFSVQDVDITRMDQEEEVLMDVERALKQQLHLLKSFCRAIKSILSPSMYLLTLSKMISIVSESVNEHIVQRLLEENGGDLTSSQCEVLHFLLLLPDNDSDQQDQSDISMISSSSFGYLDKLQKLVQDELQNLQRVEQSLSLLSAPKSGSIDVNQSKQSVESKTTLQMLTVDDILPHQFYKLKEIASILNWSLSTIEQHFDNNANRESHLEPQELVQWVRSIFSDTDKRSRLIIKIEKQQSSDSIVNNDHLI